MNTHTTMPLPWRYASGEEHSNTHVTWIDRIGNWNKHKKRRIPSRMRTAGRLRRWFLRHSLVREAIMTNNTRVTYMRVQGAGWSVFVISGTGHNRAMRRAPGFENIDNYTMAQAQVAADNLRRDIAQGLEVKQS